MTQENYPQIYCSACGQKNSGDANFCVKCGKQIISHVTAQLPSPSTIPPVPAPEKSEQKSSGIVTALAVVGFVFGLIGMLGSFLPIIGIFAIKICIGAAVISGLSIVLALSLDAKRTFPIVALTVSLIGVGMWYLQISKINSATRAISELTSEMQTNKQQQPLQQHVIQPKMQQQSVQSMIITDAFMASVLNENQMPIDKNNSFPPGPKTLYYCADVTGDIPDGNTLYIYISKDGINLDRSVLMAAGSSRKIVYGLNYDYQPGQYKVELFKPGVGFINTTNFEIR